MKKMIFSAAAFAVVAVSTAVVAPTTSEAIPAFARQTGAACLSCHFQTFPTLAPMGRSFKEGAFTDVGEQGLIEDELLSITESVNFTLVLRPQFNSKTDAAGATTNTFGIGDQVIMFAGRVGSNTGTFIEYDSTTPFANFQLLSSWDAGDAKVGIDIWNAGFGETSGMEVGSTFGQHGGALNGKNVSASNTLSGYVGETAAGAGDGGGMGGVTFFYANDMINASITALTDGGNADGKTNNSFKFAPSGRIFGHQEIGDFEMGLGFGLTSGTTGTGTTAVKMKKWMVDFQAQGEMGDMQVGFYADYAKAGGTGTIVAGTNPQNGFLGFSNIGDATGYSARLNVTPMHGIIIGGAWGSMTNNGLLGVAANSEKVRTWQLSGEYEIYQNFVVFATYANEKTTPSGGGAPQTVKSTTIDIEALL